MNDELVDRLMNFELGKAEPLELVMMMREIKQQGCILSLQSHFFPVWNMMFDKGILQDHEEDQITMLSNLQA